GGKATWLPIVLITCMDTVLVSALVDFRVQVETPLLSAAEHAPRVLLEPVEEKAGVTPEIGLLFASFRVMVMLEDAAPSATTGPVPVIVELPAVAGPAVKVTVPPVFTTGVAMDR